MSKISTLLNQILNAVNGKDVRQSIHDSIKQCYSDVCEGKTIAETAAENANAVAAQVKAEADNTISAMTTQLNLAMADCNNAASSAIMAANAATGKIKELTAAMSELGLECVDGKLRIKGVDE